MIEPNTSSIEKYLNLTLHPVRPDPGYIGKLQKQLQTAKSVILENRPQAMILKLVITGILASALILFLFRPKKKL